MKIMPIISPNAHIASNRNQKQSNYASQQSFEGGFGDVFNKFSKKAKKNKALEHLIEDIAIQIGVEPKQISSLTGSLKSRKTAFVSQLASKLGKEEKSNLGAPALEKLSDIVNNSGYITRNHISLIKHSNYSVDELKQIYSVIANSPEKNELLGKLLITAQDSSKKTRISSFAMKEYLEMKQMPEINTNYDLYRPFIEVNAEYSHAAKVLAQKLENKSYNPEYYQKLSDIVSMQRRFKLIKSIDEKVLTENYSHEGLQVLGRIDKEYSQKAIYSNSQPEFLTSIYRSTTKDNVQIRDAVVKKFVRPVPISQIEEKANLETIDYIFNSIDYRPEVRKFVENVLDNDIAISSPEALSEIISKVKLVEVNNNIPNLKRIASQNKNNNGKLIKDLNENITNTKYLKKREIKIERQNLRESGIKSISPIKYSFKKGILNLRERFLDITN